MTSKYKLHIDFIHNKVRYTPLDGGHKKSSTLEHKEIIANPSFMNNFSGQDAYMVGTIFAAKNLDKIKVSSEEKSYKYLILISILFSATLILSNLLSTKLINIGGFTTTGAMLVYPFSYIFDYIITDIYGYQHARRILWSCIISLVMFDLFIYIIILLPPSRFWTQQPELESLFGSMLRTYISSTIAFTVSFFLSSFVFQKIKIKNKGRHLFERVYKSLLVAEITDTALFCFLAFYGIWPLEQMAKYILLSYFVKVTYEIFVYSFLTKPIITYLKCQEMSDIVDTGTNFSPFKWEVKYKNSNNIYTSTQT